MFSFPFFIFIFYGVHSGFPLGPILVGGGAVFASLSFGVCVVSAWVVWTYGCSLILVLTFLSICSGGSVQSLSLSLLPQFVVIFCVFFVCKVKSVIGSDVFSFYILFFPLAVCVALAVR